MATCPAGHSSGSDDYCDVCGEQIGGAPSSPAPAAGGGTGAPPGTQTLPSPSGAGTPCPDCGTPASDRFCEQCGYDFATGGGKPTPAPANPPPAPPAAVKPAPPGPPPFPTPPPTPTQERPLPSRAPRPSQAPRLSQAPPPPTQEMPAPYSQPSSGGVGSRAASGGPGGAAGGAAWVAVVQADRDYYNSIIAGEGPDSAGIAFPPYAPERRIPLAGQQIRIGRRSSSQPVPPEIDMREPPEDPGVSHVHAVLLGKPDGTWTLVDPGSTNRTCLNGSIHPIPFNVEVPVTDGDRIHVGAWTTITLRRGEPT